MEQGKSPKLVVVVALISLVVVVAGALFAYNAASAGASANSTVTASSQGTSNAGASNAGATGADALTSSSQGEASASAHEGSSAYSLLTISDPEGSTVTLGELSEGKVTVVNIWATWCPYCVDEMQDFQALYEKHGDKIQFVMLDSADDANEVSKARDYVAEQGFTFPVFYDDGWKVQAFFKVMAYPTTIVLGADGTLLSNRPGRIDTASFDAMLAGLA